MEQQQNNLLRAVSLLHRVLVHPQELSATSAFLLKTRHSRESEVPADFGDLNSVKTAAGIFCLLQAKPIVCPWGRHTVFPPALFFSQGHIMQRAGSETENVFYLLPVSNLQQLLVWQTCKIYKNCSSLHQKSNKVFYWINLHATQSMVKCQRQHFLLTARVSSIPPRWQGEK